MAGSLGVSDLSCDFGAVKIQLAGRLSDRCSVGASALFSIFQTEPVSMHSPLMHTYMHMYAANIMSYVAVMQHDVVYYGRES